MAIDYHIAASVTVAVGFNRDKQMITDDQGVVIDDLDDWTEYPVMAIFPPPYSAVDLGSSGLSVCEAEAADGADVDPIDTADPIDAGS